MNAGGFRRSLMKTSSMRSRSQVRWRARSRSAERPLNKSERNWRERRLCLTQLSIEILAQNSREITEKTEITEQTEWFNDFRPFRLFRYFRLFRNLSSSQKS